MVSDWLRIIAGMLLAPVVLIAPGYVAGWLINFFSFRNRSMGTRLALALVSSIGLCPILSYVVGRFFSPLVWGLYGATSIAFLALVTAEFRGLRRGAKAPGRRLLWIAAGIWAALAILTLADMQLGGRLYFPVVTYDYALRSEITAAIARTGLPPHNPLFYPGHFNTLRYHYFWYILCAMVKQLGGPLLSARIAMMSATVWCGIGLMALIVLYLRFFQPKGDKDIGRRGLIGLALLCVTGMDLIPVLLIENGSEKYLGSLEWWNEQVTAWANIALWVPHHLAGLIACLTGFLILWDARGRVGLRSQVVLAATAGAMFASAAGLTIYVTFMFAVCMAVWLAVAICRNDRRHAALLCVSGIAAVVFALPFLLELAGIGGAGGAPALEASEFPFAFEVRKFPLLMAFMGFDDPQQSGAAVANLLALPLNYGVELGFFGIAGPLWCLRLWRNKGALADSQICMFTMMMTSLVVCGLVKSNVIGANDFGWRGVTIAQFVLLIWGDELLSEGYQTLGMWKVPIVLTLLVGGAGTAYDLWKIRFLPLLSDSTPAAQVFDWLPKDNKLGERTYALRQVYEELRRRVPENAVVQHNPQVAPQDSFHGMYADRQLAAETVGCGAVLGGDPEDCEDRFGKIVDLFEDAGMEPAAIERACRSLSIDILVVQRDDAIWTFPTSWIWKRKPLIANDYARVFTCEAEHMTNNGANGSNTKADAP